MLCSFPVACPNEGCGWNGGLVPSRTPGGADAEIAPRRRAWFHCPQCGRDWEALIDDDHVTALPALEHGG